MPEKRIKDRQITFRATQRFYDAVIRAARQDTRSVNSLIEKLLRDHMRLKGINPDEPPPSEE